MKTTVRSAVALLVLMVASVAHAQDASPIARIVEVVKAPDGAPAEGATVEAWGVPGGTITKRTGADGIARFDGVPRKGVVFVARLPGHLCGWHEPGRWWWSVPEEDSDPDGDGVTRMKLGLLPGTVVSGRVLDRNGEPIEGAVVEAFERAHATDQWNLVGAPLWTTTTGKDGRFRTAEHWPKYPGKDHRTVSADVMARGPGWIHEQEEIWPGDAGKQEPLTFRLHPAGTISGVVVGVDGSPVPGARVTALPSDHWAYTKRRNGRRDTNRTHPLQVEIRADEEGVYTFAEAFLGARYHLFAEQHEPGRGRRKLIARSPVSGLVGIDEQGERFALDLRLRRIGSLTVSIAADAGGTEEKARVELEPPPDTRPWVYTRDEEDGGITAYEADAGEWTVLADAPGWLPHRSTVTLEAGETKNVTVRLQRGVEVSGIVVDDDGKPVPRATVYAYTVNPENPADLLDGYEQAVTGPDGRFTIGGLRPGMTELTPQFEGMESDGDVRVEVPATDVRLKLVTRASLRFKVRPVAGAADPDRVRVTVTRLDGPYRGTQAQWELAREDGSFFIEYLMPGKVVIAVEAKEHAPFLTRLTIKPGITNEPEPFELSEGITLSGHVLDRDGKGVAGARILAWGNEENAVVTGEDGAFAIPYMIPGPVDLSVRAEGMAEALLTPRIAADSEPLTIKVSPGGVFRGTLQYEDGSYDMASLDIFPAAAKTDNVSRWRTEVKDGKFSVRLPPGKYRCNERRLGEKRGPVVFEVTEGGEVVMDLVFP